MKALNFVHQFFGSAAPEGGVRRDIERLPRDPAPWGEEDVTPIKAVLDAARRWARPLAGVKTRLSTHSLQSRRPANRKRTQG